MMIVCRVLLLSGFLLMCIIQTTSGITCLECSGVRSDQECRATGRIRTCGYRQDACEIELRNHGGWGGGLLIFKQCKESRACENNHIQNPRDAWKPTQCNPYERNSVCRCCCFTSMCNIAREQCFGQVMCPNPPNYVHRGMISCSNGRLPGSQCSTTCNSGTRLVGTKTNYCKSNGYWSHPFARCGDVICRQRIDIRNGWYSCTKGNFAGSKCRAQCRPGYILRGFRQSTCTMYGLWTLRPPFCVPILCPIPDQLIGGKAECSDGRRVQSRCRFTCDQDRTMKGLNERHCQENGKWSHKMPVCEEISCPKRPRVLHGSTTCNKGTTANSICRYKCNRDYRMRGDSTSICQIDGKWSSPLPMCLRIMCPPRGFIMFGKVRCSMGSFTKSICRAECNSGHFMVGEAQSTCSSEGEWDFSLPACRKLECRPRGPLEHGYVTCTNRNFVASNCRARCNKGRRLSGESSSTCLDSTEWSNPLPECEQIVCEPRGTVEGGTVKCTNGNLAKSICTVECELFRTIINTPVSICLDSGEWSAPLATCQRQQCRNRSRVVGGTVTCTDESYARSVCTVSCNDGKEVKGTATSSCLRSSEWSEPLATCDDILCSPRTAIIGGTVECTNSNIARSICTTICHTGRIMIGTPSSTCLNSAEWSLDLPTCQKIVCPPRTSVDNGIISCTDEFFYESECTVACEVFYDIVGDESSECMESGSWSVDLPICNKRMCPQREKMVDGQVTCSNENNINSVCEAFCYLGFKMVGVTDSECLPIGEWSDDLPVCEAIYCPSRSEVIDGSTKCTNGVNYSSRCAVTCHFTTKLVGEQFSECLGNGEWSAPLPICEKLYCDDQGDLEHGRIVCTDGTAVRSTCVFECIDEGYNVYPAERLRTVCQINQRWTLPKPCCSRSCPPYALVDVVVVMDSSSSIGIENWFMLTAFVEGILRSFIIDRTAVNFAMFRYNNEIDTESQIFLNSFPDDVEKLVQAFNKFEYNGRGTLTGKALQHALEVSLTPENGNRPDIKDVVFVITDGKAGDDVLAPSQALRERGVTVLVLGIKPLRGFLDLKQLQQIAGKQDNLVIAEAGFAGLTSEFGLKLSKTICGQPCT
uniref:P-selectin-like isoform X1 n=1 Tax=Styela clava TaxID=7725 RepID=UPI00193AB459|nr:P-selectin-like isoform X1 [Styela clava]